MDANTRLITIGPSHYCEKARWALERAGIGYSEEPHAPLVHWLFTYAVTRTRTVPVLLTDRVRLTDSTDILRFSDQFVPPEARLFPTDEPLASEVAALEARFDHELGPLTRRLAYCYLTRDRDLFLSLFAKALPPIERLLVTRGERVLRAALAKAFKVSPEAAQRLRQKLHGLFGELSKKLEDGRPYLTGPRFTAADLTFISLAEPALLLAHSEEELARLPSEFRDTVLELRATRTGRFALEVRARERQKIVVR